MTDYKIVVEGKGGIVARIVADSINKGNRITTFELEYHRYIHGEVMTHRMFSRNAMSSRAVPVNKMIEQVNIAPATPVHWGASQSGMQADNECDNPVLEDEGYGERPTGRSRDSSWLHARTQAVNMARGFQEAGYHKQIVNRLLEPFQMMKVVLTATEFTNFFWLRIDPDAQPEIQELARCMLEAMDKSTPEKLRPDEYHTPYVGHFRASDGDAFLEYHVDGFGGVSVKDAIAISSSCCAQVSYRNIDNTFEKAMSIYERLGVGGNKIHASPFEHIATPMTQVETTEGCGMDLDACDIDEGTTHCDMDGNFWSGNFKGWVQHRQELSNHVKR